MILRFDLFTFGSVVDVVRITFFTKGMFIELGKNPFCNVEQYIAVNQRPSRGLNIEVRSRNFENDEK